MKKSKCKSVIKKKPKLNIMVKNQGSWEASSPIKTKLTSFTQILEFLIPNKALPVVRTHCTNLSYFCTVVLYLFFEKLYHYSSFIYLFLLQKMHKIKNTANLPE